jgi:hypothetical protein
VECQFLLIALARSASINIPRSRHIQQYVQNAAACPRPSKIPRQLSLCDNIIWPIHFCDNVAGTRHMYCYISLLPNGIYIYIYIYCIYVCVCVYFVGAGKFFHARECFYISGIRTACEEEVNSGNLALHSNK